MKKAIVTGANVGLGLETVRGLLKENYTVIMACRNRDKALIAIEDLKKDFPDGNIIFKELDLNDLSSVKTFSEDFAKENSSLDLLVNNAGIMMPPFSLTKNGFESQFGINYLGHFALTGLLIDLLKNTPMSRVVNLSSLAHKWGDIYFEDLNFKNGYNKKKAYGQSKLACLIFSYELDRRLKSNGIDSISLAAHPGVSKTSLGRFMPSFLSFGMGLISQTASDGARPALFCALSSHLKGGEYIGPSGFQELKGGPVRVSSSPTSRDLEIAKKLWSISRDLTGVSFLE